MQSTNSGISESLVAYSHRSLWIALVFVVLTGAIMIKLVLSPGGSITPLAVMIPIAVPIMVAALRVRGGKLAEQNPDMMKSIQYDELRQHSLNLACRNGFIAALVCQPVLGFALTVAAIPSPLAVMAALTVTVSTAVVLGSVLYYDR